MFVMQQWCLLIGFCPSLSSEKQFLAFLLGCLGLWTCLGPSRSDRLLRSGILCKCGRIVTVVVNHQFAAMAELFQSGP